MEVISVSSWVGRELDGWVCIFKGESRQQGMAAACPQQEGLAGLAGEMGGLRGGRGLIPGERCAG